MSDLKELHTDYLNRKDKGIQVTIKMHDKVEEISGLKLQMTEIKERLAEVDNHLSIARKGIDMMHSSDELMALKKELVDKKVILSDLQDLLIMQTNALANLKSMNMNYAISTRAAESQLIAAIIAESAEEIATAVNDKLKFLVNMVLSEIDYSMIGYDVNRTLYFEIGKNLCQQVFTSAGDNSSIPLPSLDESLKARELFIENLS